MEPIYNTNYLLRVKLSKVSENLIYFFLVSKPFSKWLTNPFFYLRLESKTNNGPLFSFFIFYELTIIRNL